MPDHTTIWTDKRVSSSGYIQKAGLFLQISFTLTSVESLHMENVRLNQPDSIIVLYMNNPNQITLTVLQLS